MEHLLYIRFYDLLWYFILYAFIGWCLEVVFCSVNTGKFVNRGFLNGPVCPIYGFGAVIVVVLLTPISDNILLLYGASVVLTSLLELVAGFLLKKLFHTTWWDYSDQPFNIGGYICLKFSLLWGIACIFLMKLIHPALAGLVGLVPQVLGWVLLGLLYTALLADLGVTVAAIGKLNRTLGEMTRIAESLRGGSEAMAQALGNSAIAVAAKIDELDLDEKVDELAAKLQENKESLKAHLEESKADRAPEPEVMTELKARMQELINSRQRVSKRLMRAFPSMANAKYAGAFETLKKRLQGAADANENQDETEQNTAETPEIPSDSQS